MTNSEQIQALKERAECVCGILENIAGYEPEDIDGDDVELRFETEGGFDTGCNVSIVEQCQAAADVIRSLLAERDADKALIAEQAKRIAELEARIITVKLADEKFCPAEYAGSQLWDETEIWNQAVSACETALKNSCAKQGITLVVEE